MRSPTPEVFSLLGLSKRAGAVVAGTDSVRRAVRDGRALLVLIAGDASEVQLDKIRTTMRDRAIPQARLGDRNTLGAAVGGPPLSVVAITDGSLARRLIEGLERATPKGGTDEVEA